MAKKFKLNESEQNLINQIILRTGYTEGEILAFFIEMGSTFIITVMQKKAVDIMKDFKTMVRAEPKLKIIVEVIQQSVKSASKINIKPENNNNNLKVITDGKASNND